MVFRKKALQLFTLLTVTQIDSPQKTEEKPVMLFSMIMQKHLTVYPTLNSYSNSMLIVLSMTCGNGLKTS